MAKKYVITIEDDGTVTCENYGGASFLDNKYSKEVEELEIMYKAQIDDLKEKLIASENSGKYLQLENSELRDRVSGLKKDGEYKDDMIIKYLRENAELKRKLHKVKECTAAITDGLNTLEANLNY